VLVRNPEGDAVRSLYLTNGIIKTIVEHNDYTRLRIINCGTKVFTKQDGGRGMDPSFRVLGEGLPVVLPYIHPETIMDCDIGILKTLLSIYYPLCGAFPEPFKSATEALGECFCFMCRLILRCPLQSLEAMSYDFLPMCGMARRMVSFGYIYLMLIFTYITD